MSRNGSNRPRQVTAMWFLICSLVFTFQRSRDLGLDLSSLVLSSWLNHWMKGTIFLIFLHKQDLQKMIHTKFWITLVKCLTDRRRKGVMNIYTRAMSTCTHHSALQLPSNLTPSHKTSCPFRGTTDDLWSFSASSKLFGLPLTALCSDNHSVESLLRSRGKKLSCYYTVTFHKCPKV